MHYTTQDYKLCNSDIRLTSNIEYYHHYKSRGIPEGRICNRKTLQYTNEFGGEVAIFIPYIYYLWKNNLLQITDKTPVETFEGMQPFYYFVDPKLMKYKNTQRWFGHDQVKNSCIPLRNKSYMTHDVDPKYWIPPPYREVYKNDEYVYDKPLLVITNKNNDWRGKNINFISVDALRQICKMLSPYYQLVYIRPSKTVKLKGYSDDNSFEQENNGDIDMIKQEFPNVLFFNELAQGKLYNEVLLKLFANCTNYICVQGGSSYIASYFAEKMCVYHQRGMELAFDSYNGFLKRLNKSEIKVSRDNKKLVLCVSDMFISR